MRVICSSATAATDLAAGLTQLEWLERVAARTGADGVALDVHHFPRHDPEYLAHLRKIAVDLGIELLAIEAPALLDPATPEPERARLLALAAGCGAALLRTRLGRPGEVPPEAFAAGVSTARAVARAAKAINLTVAVEPAAGTIGADIDSVRRLVKDVDSAWLRYAAPAGITAGFGSRDRVVLRTALLDDDPARTATLLRSHRAPLILGGGTAGDPFEAVARWVERLRQSTAAAV